MAHILKFVSRLSQSVKLCNKFIKRSEVRCWSVLHEVRFVYRKPFSFKATREFHVSSPRKAIPPIVLILLRPVMKISAMLFGRSIRKWWQRLTPEQREIIKAKIRARQTQIVAAGTVAAGGVYIYYLEHIVEEPITKRKRFIVYTDEQMKMIADLELLNQIESFRPDIIPHSHPIYKRVVRVAMRLLLHNRNLKQVQNKIWTVTVIDKPEITNAFVLPNGCIFVFTGMLNICTNDDQLAIVLAHEMSHAILSHVAENLSKVLFVDTLLLVPLILMWATLPDAAALFSQWLSSQLAQVMIHLPFNRKIETEADVVGLQLAARACYDVREAPVFWGKMKYVSETEHNDPIPIEWLSTHPSHGRRQVELGLLVPDAMKIRDANACPALPPLNQTQLYYGNYGVDVR